MIPTKPPTPEQVSALREYATRNGRTWKAQLRVEWEKSAAGSVLQTVRNQFGNEWLAGFRLTTEVKS